jgi:hypothetical protein
VLEILEALARRGARPVTPVGRSGARTFRR